jgi:hypothetical protein
MTRTLLKSGRVYRLARRPRRRTPIRTLRQLWRRARAA